MSRRAELEARLRAAALAYPGAEEHFPWGERVVKVNGRIFAFLRASADHPGFTMKLPAAHPFAQMMPGCEPAGHGLGKSDWRSSGASVALDLPCGPRNRARAGCRSAPTTRGRE
jgi:predicted DNA-binding protein (MmcQ/YjbR family)